MALLGGGGGGHFGNPDWCEVLNVRWEPWTGGRKQCCDIYEDWARTQCFMICVLCCKKIVITFGPCDSESDSDAEPTDDARNYPPVTVNGNGLSFTTSAYGAPLPIVFGSDKLTGNVFWASSVRKILINGGAEYYQTVDFALGLCEGEINGILRMWLGEKLILDRTADVDNEGVAQASSTGFIAGASIDLTDSEGPLRDLNASERQTKIDVYVGSEYQLPDPTMVEAEGYEFAPGYRGTSYILFRNFIVPSTTIPNIFVELTSNTETPYPRRYGLYETPIAAFNEPHSEASLLVDVSYDILHVASRDDTGTATPPSGEGIATFNFNTLELENETELLVTEGINPNYTISRLMPVSGNIFLHGVDGNAGLEWILNPHSQQILGTLGPGGGVGDHSITEGLSALNNGTLVYSALGAHKFGQVDVIMGIGIFNRSIGFVEVDAEGQMVFVRNLSNVMTNANARSVFLPITTEFSNANPTFHDGTSTSGHWIFIFNYDAGGDTTQFQIGRIKVGDTYGNSLLETCTYSEPDIILVDDLRGAGLTHAVSHILVDPADGCLVVFVVLSNAGTTPMVFKYSPYTGNIVWKTSAPGYELCRGADMAYLTNSRYAWITGQGAVYRLDMSVGEVEQLESQISTYDLPLPNYFDQFYNGMDESITYLTNTADQRITKIYLEKLTRATVELGDIVEHLLGRVGLLGTDMDVSDVDDLTLRGYTISKRQSLRTCFGELAQAFKFDVVESNGRIKYLTRGRAAAATIPKKWFGDVDEEGWLNAKDENDIARIRKISMTYRDIDREYKDNVQSITLPNTSSRTFDNDSSISVSVPIVLDAATAKSLSEILLYAKLVYDTTYEGVLPERFSFLDPGDVVTIQPDDTGSNDFDIRLRKLTIGADRSVKFEASREDPDIYNDVVNLFGDIGRYVETKFKPIPPRVDPIILEMPYRSDEEAETFSSVYRLYVTYLNLRPSQVVDREVGLRVNGKDNYLIPAATNFPTWGYIIDPPLIRSSIYSTDYESAMRVKIMSTTGAALASATHADLLASDQCNLCWVGGELMQFETVTHEGGSVYLFEGLHRAKFNTATSYGTQVSGTRFVLLSDNLGVLDEGGILPVSLNITDPSLVVQIFMRSSNPLQPKPVVNVRALNLNAWSVADLQAAYNIGTGDAEYSWSRRTRYDGEYPDDGDETPPINEIDESYVIFLYTDDTLFDTQNASTYLRRIDTTTTSYTYTDALQTTDGFDRTTTDLFMAIYQQGSATGYRFGTATKVLLEPLV
jgi:hypothetical protein